MVLYMISSGPRTIHKKVTNQPKSCRSFPFLNNADQHYIVPALKRCVELLVNVCRSLVTYSGPTLMLIISDIFNNFYQAIIV